MHTLILNETQAAILKATLSHLLDNPELCQAIEEIADIDITPDEWMIGVDEILKSLN